MSNQHLLSAFEGDGENVWQDDREFQASGGGLLNSLSRRATGTPPGPGSSLSTDAVFGNLLAKQEAPSEAIPHDDETPPEEEPPTYLEASNDSAPNYWETTIMAPEWYDDVLVDELAVGSTLQLVWNVLISFTFGLAGFLGTYAIHTSHASHAGSIIGLALTLIQNNYDGGPTLPTSPLVRDPDEFLPDNPNSYENRPLQTGSIQHGLQLPSAPGFQAAVSASWRWMNLALAFFLIWWSLSGYIRACRIKKAVLRESSAPEVAEQDLESLFASEPDAPEPAPEPEPAPAPEPTTAPEPAPDYNTPSH